MTLLSALVAASGRIRQTRSRTAKVHELAALLRALEPAEIGIATHYLSGETPQGRIGVGYTTLRAAAKSSSSRGAKARPTRPPMTVPEPPDVTRERKLTARTALVATASRSERAGDICVNATP